MYSHSSICVIAADSHYLEQIRPQTSGNLKQTKKLELLSICLVGMYLGSCTKGDQGCFYCQILHPHGKNQTESETSSRQ